MTPPLPPAGRWAGRYAERLGWRVLPCRPRGKEPLVPGGVHAATRDPGEIEAWWRRWPAANVAVVPGPGWCVVDLDTPQAAAALAASGWELPATAAVTTARGRHFYYRAQAAVPSRCAVADGVDVAGTDGARYLLAPPSVHPTGAVYRWEVPPGDAAPAPEWVYTLAGAGAGGSGPRPPLRELLARRVEQGHRNDTMTRVAGLAFRVLPAREAVMLCGVLNERYFEPPLAEDELEAILASVASLELRRRERGMT